MEEEEEGGGGGRAGATRVPERCQTTGATQDLSEKSSERSAMREEVRGERSERTRCVASKR